jgi:hypothetical protein
MHTLKVVKIPETTRKSTKGLTCIHLEKAKKQHTAASRREGLKEYQVSKASKIATEKWKKANQDSFFGKEFPQRG